MSTRGRLIVAARVALMALPAAILALAVWGLKALPYSSSLIDAVSIEEVATQCSGPDFALGAIRWEVRRYAADPTLARLRAYCREIAGDARGLAAALRVSRSFAARSPIGEPAQEFFDADYDPTRALLRHIQGGPGHCVTRASSVAAVLLSAGIPARVVQFLPLGPDGRLRLEDGHTVLEVWDDRHGWSLLDPMFGGVIGDKSGPCSAARAVRMHGDLRLLKSGKSNEWYAADKGYYMEALKHGFSLMYPEPWLYLRAGPRSAPGFYRGRYACAGARHRELGPIQKLLGDVIVLDSFAFVLSCMQIAITFKYRISLNRYGAAVGRARGGSASAIARRGPSAAGRRARIPACPLRIM